MSRAAAGWERRFITDLLTQLTEHIDVVLLNTGHRFDDHADFAAVSKGRVHTVEHLMRPETNLAVQTEIIRNAQAFVGTYGGFSYLAPLLGVDGEQAGDLEVVQLRERLGGQCVGVDRLGAARHHALR